MYEQEIYKLLGENLDSNGTMVLFADKTIECTVDGDTGEISGKATLFSKTIEYSGEVDFILEALKNYFKEKAKSHAIIFRLHLTMGDDLDGFTSLLYSDDNITNAYMGIEPFENYVYYAYFGGISGDVGDPLEIYVKFVAKLIS